MVAGSGAATARIGGTPTAASSGVAIAEPPLPNRPPMNPTAAPMSMIAGQFTTSSGPPVVPSVQTMLSMTSIGFPYGDPPIRVRRRRRRARRLHEGGRGHPHQPAVAVAGHPL